MLEGEKSLISLRNTIPHSYIGSPAWNKQKHHIVALLEKHINQLKTYCYIASLEPSFCRLKQNCKIHLAMCISSFLLKSFICGCWRTQAWTLKMSWVVLLLPVYFFSQRRFHKKSKIDSLSLPLLLTNLLLNVKQKFIVRECCLCLVFHQMLKKFCLSWTFISETDKNYFGFSV